MKIKLNNHFKNYDIENVYKTFLTEEFHLFKSHASGDKNIEVLECTTDQENFQISIKSEKQSEVFGMDIPKMVLQVMDSYGIAKLLGQEAMTIIYTESWSLAKSNIKYGNFEIKMNDVPVVIKGESVLINYFH